MTVRNKGITAHSQRGKYGNIEVVSLLYSSEVLKEVGNGADSDVAPYFGNNKYVVRYQLIMFRLNKNLFYLLALTMTACSSTAANVGANSDAQFESHLKYLIEDSGLKERIVFRELYGYEKAKLEAKEYCQKLDKGETRDTELYKYSDSLFDKVDKKVISEEERDAMIKVKIAIFLTAENAYCPQHIDKGKVPLSERLKK